MSEQMRGLAPRPSWEDTHIMDMGEARRAFASMVKILDGVRWVPFLGTLVGAVERKGFIPWDTDIDISPLEDDITPDNDFIGRCMDEGFKVSTSYMPRGSAYKLERNKIVVDVAPYRVGREYASVPFWNMRAFFPAFHFCKLVPASFEGMKIALPTSARSLVKFMYGHWKHPKDFGGANNYRFLFLFRYPIRDLDGAHTLPVGMTRNQGKVGELISWEDYRQKPGPR